MILDKGTVYTIGALSVLHDAYSTPTKNIVTLTLPEYNVVYILVSKVLTFSTE